VLPKQKAKQKAKQKREAAGRQPALYGKPPTGTGI